MSGGRKRPVGRDERKSQLTNKAKKSRRSGSMAMSGQVCVSKFSFLFSRHFFPTEKGHQAPFNGVVCCCLVICLRTHTQPSPNIDDHCRTFLSCLCDELRELELVLPRDSRTLPTLIN